MVLLKKIKVVQCPKVDFFHESCEPNVLDPYNAHSFTPHLVMQYAYNRMSLF